MRPLPLGSGPAERPRSPRPSPRVREEGAAREEQTLAAEGECEGLAFPAAVYAQAMERTALRGKARLCSGSAVQFARLLARLRESALPARPALHASAPLLLGPQARDGTGGLGESCRAVPAAARTSLDRLAERLGRAVAVLNPFQNAGSASQAVALGRAETFACQRRTLANSSGSGSFGTFMKSTAVRAVISAM